MDEPGNKSIPSGSILPQHPEEEGFGEQPSCPTARRPIDFRRSWPEPIDPECLQAWLDQAKIGIGSQLTELEREQAIGLLYHWRDLFVEEMNDIQATDFVVHTIPTFPNERPLRAREPYYAPDEVHWQVNVLPQMFRGGIIQRGTPPWVTKTTWVNKKSTVVDTKKDFVGH